MALAPQQLRTALSSEGPSVEDRRKATRQLRVWSKIDSSIRADDDSIRLYIEVKKLCGKQTVHLREFKSYKAENYLQAEEKLSYWKVPKWTIVNGIREHRQFPEGARGDLVELTDLADIEVSIGGLAINTDDYWFFREEQQQAFVGGWRYNFQHLDGGAAKHEHASWF